MVKPLIRWVAVLCMATILTVLSSNFAQAQIDSPVDDAQGALIVAVISGSPASDAGLVRGDVILAVGDQAVNSSADLRALVPDAAPGDVLPLTIRHGDDTFIVDVELGDQDGRAFLGVYLARDLEEPVAEESSAEMTEEEAVEAEEPAAEEAMAEEPAPEESVTEEAAPADAQPTEEAVEEPVTEEPAAGEQQAEPEAEATEMPQIGNAGSEEPEAVEEPEETEAVEPDVYGMIPYTDTAGGAMLFSVVDGSPADEAGLQVGDVIMGVGGERFQSATDLADVVDAQMPGQELALDVLRRSGDLEQVTVVLGEHPDEAGQAYLGIGYLPTPRRMFLGHGPHGDLLVPPMPFDWHGPGSNAPDRWFPRAHPRFHWMPEGHPGLDGCDNGMPWWACEEHEGSDSGESDDMDKSDGMDDSSGDSAHVYVMPVA